MVFNVTSTQTGHFVRLPKFPKRETGLLRRLRIANENENQYNICTIVQNYLKMQAGCNNISMN